MKQSLSLCSWLRSWLALGVWRSCGHKLLFPAWNCLVLMYKCWLLVFAVYRHFAVLTHDVFWFILCYNHGWYLLLFKRNTFGVYSSDVGEQDYKQSVLHDCGIPWDLTQLAFTIKPCLVGCEEAEWTIVHVFVSLFFLSILPYPVLNCWTAAACFTYVVSLLILHTWSRHRPTVQNIISKVTICSPVLGPICGCSRYSC